MVFGTVQHVPALQLQEIPTAFTTAPFAVVDRSLIAELPRSVLRSQLPEVQRGEDLRT
jgi:hypothetical protein